MKKLLLSFTVILTFIGYSMYQKNQASQVPLVSSKNKLLVITPTITPQSVTTSPKTSMYQDGVYTGAVKDAYYGNIQVQAVIQNGKITDVQFLQYPNDRDTSIQINTQAMPILKQEVI